MICHGEHSVVEVPQQPHVRGGKAVPLLNARRLLNLPLNQHSERVTAAITRECAYERMHEVPAFVVFTLVEPNREYNRPLFVANKLLIEVREHLFLVGPARPVDGVVTAPTNFGGHHERLADNVFKLVFAGRTARNPR